MKEYKIVINNQEFIIKQDYDGKFIKPDFIKEYEKVGSALKPSFEPIIVARKPFKGSLVDNVIEYGVGGINIDECRVYRDKEDTSGWSKAPGKASGFAPGDNSKMDYTKPREQKPDNELGRFPANTILTYDDTDYDEVCGGFPDTKGNGNIRHNHNSGKINNCYGKYNDCASIGYEDSGNASRYFYCAKASKKDRDEGMDNFEDNYMAFSNQAKAELKRGNVDFKGNEDNPMNFVNSVSVRKNTHPTVKPTELMQYLVRLVTPNNGIILDPFNGSGSTGKAAMYENKERNKNYKYIGIELTEEYLPISKARIEAAFKRNNIQEKSKQTKEMDENQTTIFDFLKGSDKG